MAGKYSDRVPGWLEDAGIVGIAAGIGGLIVAVAIGSGPLLLVSFVLVGMAGLVPSVCDLIDSQTREPFRPTTWKSPPARDAVSNDATQGEGIAPETGEWRFQERVLAERNSRGPTLH
jgi:hypothetical protein